jgi:hypothetical protein
MKNKKTWITIIVLVLLLGGCFGDRVISEIVFYYQCDKNSGLYVYEEVNLSDEYFTKESKSEKEFNYFYNEYFFITKNMFDYEYLYIPNKITTISSFGPIKLIESLVYRRTDNKLLGKLTTVSNGLGWVVRSWSFGYAGKGCPAGFSEKGERVRNKMRREFIENIFIKK